MTRRGISAETCGLDDVFPPDDLCSRPGTLCHYIFIYTYAFFIRVLVIGCIYIYIHRECHSVLVELHPITVYRAGFWERAVPLLNATCCFLWFQPFVSYSMVIRLILGCLWPLVSVLNDILTLGILRSVIFHLPGCFWYSPLGEYYCHRHSSDSCRRDFNLVSLICRLWNALSTSGGSVHVYRFSTIFAIDRVWFGSMSMYSSRKRQLLLCESCFAEALELPLESFLCPDQAVPTLHNPTVNMCPSIRRK